MDPETDKAESKEKLSRWLDGLQQESWQLELIISGFVIFLLIGGWQAVTDYEFDMRLLVRDNRAYMPLFFLYMSGRTAYFSLLICLIIHVVMRGLWIAAVGLRSVSGEIHYDALGYQPRYRNWLRRRIGSFDDYVLRLERYCSVIFTVAFLILFCFLSLGSWAVCMIGIQELFSWVTGYRLGNDTGVLRGGGMISAVLVLFSIVYFVDFASLGFFKRNRYTARPYYYLYRVMGWITLARLYRPLYYNLIDHRFGRRLARLLPLFILAILCLVSLKLVKYAYYPYYIQDGGAFIDSGSYMDEAEWTPDDYDRVTLEGRYPNGNYVAVFVPYLPVYQNEVLEKLHPGLEAARFTGTKLEGAFVLGQSSNERANNDSLLMAFTGLHELLLDGETTDVQPRFHSHPVRRQPGLLYMLPTHRLEEGEHSVRVRTRVLRQDSLAWVEGYGIYFYK